MARFYLWNDTHNSWIFLAYAARGQPTLSLDTQGFRGRGPPVACVEKLWRSTVLDLFVAVASSPPPMPKGVNEIKLLIETWTRIGQALVASVGSLAFIFALACTG
jgi:hypothetical protein